MTRQSKYYQEHREKCLADNRAWVEANRVRKNEIALKSFHKRKKEKENGRTKQGK